MLSKAWFENTFTKKSLIPILCVVLIAYLGATHRYILFRGYFDDLTEFVSQNPNILTYQFLAIPALTNHFWRSILYLQQTPPIPNIILGVAAKHFGWPVGTAYCLIAMQAFLSIASALLLFRLLFFISKNVYLNCFLVVLFLFSTDTLVMEYNTFGQNFYENLAMLLLLIVIYCFFKLIRTENIVYTALLGFLTASLALTRASYSYFFVIPLAFLTLSKHLTRRKHHMIAFSVLIVLLHGGWCGKNLIVYRTFSLSTSSWKGVNFAAGLNKAGMGETFLTSIFHDRAQYPEWFIEMLEKEGVVSWYPPKFLKYLPDEIQQQDKQIQSLLGNTNRPENFIGLRVMSDLYIQAYPQFFFTQPKLIRRKFLMGYMKFWEPIRNFGIMYMGPLFIIPKIRNSFRIDQVLKAYFTQGIEEQFFMTGNTYDKKGIPVSFYTIPYFPMLVLIMNILVIHLLLPLLLIYAVARQLIYKEKLFSAEFFFLLASFLYAVVVMNLPEYGENMRFRLSIEPVIWLISMYTLTTFMSLIKKQPIKEIRIADEIIHTM